MQYGLLILPWWGYVGVALLFTHITIVSVTIFLHRSQAHNSVDLNRGVAHFFRFWLWLTTGMNTREWAAVHRKHHAMVETSDDPHSPVFFGLRTLLLQGAELYRVSAQDQDLVRQYGYGTPNDWIEVNLYSRFRYSGIVVMFLLDVIFFGPVGITIGAVQMMWIPFFAAGVINGLGHNSGYRNFETDDNSTNLVPFGILIGGEELHNNHHAFAMSAKFSVQPWEVDIGWFYLSILQRISLAKIKRVAPQKLDFELSDSTVDFDTLKAVVSNRLHVMADYHRRVVKKVYKREIKTSPRLVRDKMRGVGNLIFRNEKKLSEQERDVLNEVFFLNKRLEVVYGFRQKLNAFYERRTQSRESLVALLEEWCFQAEKAGIAELQLFAKILRGYRTV
jgi:stearoyl-CoA desaturase (delta-9 desaturase)